MKPRRIGPTGLGIEDLREPVRARSSTIVVDPILLKAARRGSTMSWSTWPKRTRIGRYNNRLTFHNASDTPTLAQVPMTGAERHNNSSRVARNHRPANDCCLRFTNADPLTAPVAHADTPACMPPNSQVVGNGSISPGACGTSLPASEQRTPDDQTISPCLPCSLSGAMPATIDLEFWEAQRTQPSVEVLEASMSVDSGSNIGRFTPEQVIRQMTQVELDDGEVIMIPRHELRSSVAGHPDHATKCGNGTTRQTQLAVFGGATSGSQPSARSLGPPELPAPQNIEVEITVG